MSKGNKVSFIYSAVQSLLYNKQSSTNIIKLGKYTIELEKYSFDGVEVIDGDENSPRKLEEKDDLVTEYLYNRLQDQDYGQKVFSVFYSTFYDYFVEFFCDNDDALANAGLNEKADVFLKSIKDKLLNDSDIKNIMLSLKTQGSVLHSIQSSVNVLKECQKRLDIATFNAENQFAEY